MENIDILRGGSLQTNSSKTFIFVVKYYFMYAFIKLKQNLFQYSKVAYPSSAWRKGFKRLFPFS